MQKSLFALATAAVIGLTAPQAVLAAPHDEVYTQTFDVGHDLSGTNWRDSLSLAKFDSKLGFLQSITFSLAGQVQGTGKAESLDADASEVTLILSSLLTLYRPDNSALVVAHPIFSETFALSPFDGTIDFAGTSGASTGLRSNIGSNSFVSRSSSDFDLFSANGGGFINLGLNAIGTSNASGSGNLVTQFETAAAGRLTVTYAYISAVPEPETYVMMLTGLALAGVVARRRKAAKTDIA